MPSVSQYTDKNEYQRQYRKENPDKYNEYYRRYREKARAKRWEREYGLTKEKYFEMLKNQDYKCNICLGTDAGRGHQYFHVDHCHKTKKVRGLLCDLCNRGLGYFKDNPEVLKRASVYLEESNEKDH